MGGVTHGVKVGTGRVEVGVGVVWQAINSTPQNTIKRNFLNTKIEYKVILKNRKRPFPYNS
jgi:hypothetical protein